MNIQTILANKANYTTSPRVTSSIKYIVIHYTANSGDTAVGNGNYFKNNVTKASAHYFVDKNGVVQSVMDDCTAWSVGGDKYADCSTTGGGKWYNICKNSNSISIELCNGTVLFDSETINNAAELIHQLMNKYNIGIDNVIRHFDVTGKICPKPFINDTEWQNFKNKIIGDDIDMATAAELEARLEKLENKMIYNYIDTNTAKIAPDANDALNAAIKKGILAGNGDGLNLTEDLVKMHISFYRLGLYN